MTRPWAVFVWIFFVAGGVFTRTGHLESVRSALAAPVQVATAGAVSAACLRVSRDRGLAVAWLAGVFCLGTAVEAVGVATGFPFGDYRYGPALGPAIGGVPVVIGCAWVTAVVFGAAVAQAAGTPGGSFGPRGVAAGSAAVVLFDVLLEPAAVALGYWTWGGDGTPPASNYAAWGVIGWATLWTAGRVRLFTRPLGGIVRHLIGAEVVYFLLAG